MKMLFKIIFTINRVNTLYLILKLLVNVKGGEKMKYIKVIDPDDNYDEDLNPPFGGWPR